MKISLFLFILTLTIISTANSKKSINWGHSLTPTSQTPSKNTVVFGSAFAGYGVTDDFFLGSSTWMIWGYNSYNFIGRYAVNLPQESSINSIGVQLMYLKSGDFSEVFGSKYIMETVSTWLVFSSQLSSSNTLNFSLNYMHFFNETIPHSFRREPFNNEPWQVSITMLDEVFLTNHQGLNVEFGILGANYKLPWLQAGLSYFYQDFNWHLQFGISNSSVINPSSPLLDSGVNSSRTTIHPEVQLQYFW